MILFCCCLSHFVTLWWSQWDASMSAGYAILCYRFCLSERMWNMMWFYTSVLVCHGFEVMAGGAHHLSSCAIVIPTECILTDTYSSSLLPFSFLSLPNEVSTLMMFFLVVLILLTWRVTPHCSSLRGDLRFTTAVNLRQQCMHVWLSVAFSCFFFAS